MSIDAKRGLLAIGDADVQQKRTQEFVRENGARIMQ